jgi:hypothetical protein
MRLTYFQNEGYVAMEHLGRMPFLTPPKPVCNQIYHKQVFLSNQQAKAFPGK